MTFYAEVTNQVIYSPKAWLLVVIGSLNAALWENASGGGLFWCRGNNGILGNDPQLPSFGSNAAVFVFLLAPSLLWP